MKEKIQNSVHILREATARFSNPIILWAGGKDSTVVVHLAKQMTPKGVDFPFKTILLDTTFQFTETYHFLDRLSSRWNVPFSKIRNNKALRKNINPEDYSKFECCNKLKTENLGKFLKRTETDAVIEGIRWDEHPARGKTTGESGDFKDLGFYQRSTPVEHIRIYPIQNWSEKDVWNYSEQEELPSNPLYDYNPPYRSIGCWPCTNPVKDSEADEREGRNQDKELVMERLRELGYM